MSKHTPGPWRTHSANEMVIMKGEGLCNNIASTCISDVCRTVSEADANARLIAAAPKMYELLQAIVDCASGTLQTNTPALETIEISVRNLLAQIQGGRP